MSKGLQPAWSTRDTCLWETCWYLAALARGEELRPFQPVMTAYVPQGGPGDILLCQAMYERLGFRAVGVGRAPTMPRWIVEEAGILTIGTAGFHLQNQTGIFYWDWESITSLQVTGLGLVEMFGNSTGGPVHWAFASERAELIFILWACARHHQHPQLLSGLWLPVGFAEWAAHNGFPLPV